jgi:hypothetical protein
MAHWNTAPVQERFWRFVEPDPNSGCWLWSGAHDKDGYGLIRENYKNVRAHRLSYEMHKGAVGADLMVCHRCDVPSCVNPDHLFLGDNSDNQIDCARKGRNASQKLTVDAVREMRRIWAADNGSHKRLVEQFGVSSGIVSQIVNGRKWRHVD